MPFAVYRVTVDEKGAFGPRQQESSRSFQFRDEAVEYAERTARSHGDHGVNDEHGYWWCRDEEGRKVLLIVSAHEPDSQHGVPMTALARSS